MTDETTPRVDALRQAATIIAGDRDVEYGGPEDNFGRIAAIWSVIMEREITTTQVAAMMVAVKLARLVNTKGAQSDSWVDIAGYAACGYELMGKEREKE